MVFFMRCIERKTMGKFTLRSGDMIELDHYDGGATAPMGIRVKKNGSILIEDWEKFSSIYKVSFQQINDTLVKVTLTDTMAFEGQSIIKMVNVNHQVVE